MKFRIKRIIKRPTFEIELEGNYDPKQLEIELNVAVSELPQLFPGLTVHVRPVTDNYLRPPRTYPPKAPINAEP